jgi:nicotinamidase/pyrazinamidase
LATNLDEKQVVMGVQKFIPQFHSKKNEGWTFLSAPYSLTESDALIVIDIQIDFLPGGALPVPNGDEIIPAINNYIKRFKTSQAQIIASRDWHPLNHTSFKTQGGPWPPHCIQDTSGAKFSPALKLPLNTTIISKATQTGHEAYSAFDHTNLAGELHKYGVKRLFASGLATDYCVLNTVIDACRLGFETIVLMDATLGINTIPGDVDRAVETMHKNGAKLATETDFPNALNMLPIEETTPDKIAEKPSMLTDAKKKARMRSRGVNKRLKTEHHH